MNEDEKALVNRISGALNIDNLENEIDLMKLHYIYSRVLEIQSIIRQLAKTSGEKQ